MMPKCAIHWEQAEHNELMALDIIKQEPIKYKDWAEIISFYSAVHYVEAYLADQLDLHSGKDAYKQSPHSYRSNIVRQRLSKITMDYDELLTASKILRYLTDEAGNDVTATMGNYFTEEDLKDFFYDNLQNIKMEIARILDKETSRYSA